MKYTTFIKYNLSKSIIWDRKSIKIGASVQKICVDINKVKIYRNELYKFLRWKSVNI